ncbi:HEAT repeat domain-containing protein [Planctomycetota bacterium]
MENEEKFLEFVGTASERAGTFAGKVAGIGDKIAGLAAGSVSAGKEMLGLADEKVKHTPEKKSGITKTSTLKSDLTATRRKLANAEKTQSKLESQMKELKTENHSLVSQQDQMRSELSETKSREGAVRARAAALESEIDDIRSQLEEAQSKPAKTTAVGTGRNKRKAELESELAAIQRELEKTQNKAEKTQSEFTSQLETIQAENKSLSSDLEKTQSKAKQVRVELESEISQLQSENKSLKSDLEKQRSEDNKMLDLEDELKTRTAQLEADLAATQGELAETQNKTEKIQTDLGSQLKDLQVEKESLILDLEKSQNKVNEMTYREEQASEQVAKLESELVAVRQELVEIQNQSEHTQAELKKQHQQLQAKNKSLISELDQARKAADDAQIRADSVEAQIASLESNVAAASLKPKEASEEESDIDTTLPQTDYQEKATVVPTDEINPSIEADVTQEELIDTDVENVEEPEPEPILEFDTEVDAEEIEPEPMPEVELTEPVEVTLDDVQVADFKNEAERIIFTKAISDFTSADTAARVDAAKAIGDIAHELSARLIVAHLNDEPSAVVRQECIKVLATLETAEGLSVVENALTDETASVRLAAVWGIYRLAEVESLPKLLEMLSDSDEGVRRRAVTCIGWLGGQLKTIGESQLRRVVLALIGCLDDSAESTRKATLDALQAVTGKKMSKSRISPERLIEQWRNWWKAELLG